MGMEENLIVWRFKQLEFFCMRQQFELCLSLTGTTACVTTLLIHHLQWLPSSKILGSFPLCMLAQTSCHVSGDAGVERTIGTEDDIDLPTHFGTRKTLDRIVSNWIYACMGVV